MAVKDELVVPIIGNLHDALAISKARYLFPSGVNIQALIMCDVSLLFTAARFGQDDVISFNQIGDLEAQARAARACLGYYQEIKAFTDFVEKVDKLKEPAKDVAPSDPKDDDYYGNPQYPDYFTEPGTSFLDIYPYRKGETPEDIKRSYQRITQGGYFQGVVDEPHRGEYFEVHLDDQGKLTGWHGYQGSWAYEDSRTEIDVLHERLPNKWADEERKGTIHSLIGTIESELRTNRRALELAKANFSTTSFTVETGFLEALTDRSFRKSTKTEELAEERKLVKEVRKMLGEESSPDHDHQDTDVVVFDNQPVDKRTLDMDFRILRAIRDNDRMSTDDLMGALFGGNVARDNIGDWFSSSSALLSRFRGLLTDGSEYLVVLGIEPTNDEATIRRAYRGIARATHPDLLSSLPAEDQLKAADKFIKATEAYDNLMNKTQNELGDSFSPTYYLGRISKLFPPSA